MWKYKAVIQDHWDLLQYLTTIEFQQNGCCQGERKFLDHP